MLAVDTGDASPVEWEPSEEPTPARSAGRGTCPGGPGIGSPVIALANPGGRGLRATLGFVSSGGRSFRGPRGRRIRGAIEHTAPLPRGSSGGPLVDPDGNLLGVNSLRLDGGLILAVPAGAAVKERVLGLARGEAVSPHRLGVAVAPAAGGASPPPRGRPPGARRPAGARGGGREARRPRPASSRGDLIVAAAGEETEGIEALYTALDSVPAAGGDLELTVVRGTDERNVAVTFRGEQAA